MNLPALYTLFTSALLSPKVVFSQQSTILFPSLCSVEHKHVFIFIIFHNKMFFVVVFFIIIFMLFLIYMLISCLKVEKHTCAVVQSIHENSKRKKIKKKTSYINKATWISREHL